MDKNNQPIKVCGKFFKPELIEHLNQLQAQDPALSNRSLARIICELLPWSSPDGRLAVTSARVALSKLRAKGVLEGPKRRSAPRPHRLRASGNPVPAVVKVPPRVGQVKGLHLHLIDGAQDPLHLVWNDLIIQQHPCGAAPLVGAQLRYLIGSDHGWLGALGFGPAAFVLAARDQWIGWSTAARLNHLREVAGLSRFLIRTEVRCANLASKALSLGLECLPRDWLARYGVKLRLVETFVDRTRFTGRCFAAANWRRVGASTGQGRLGPREKTRTVKDIWVYELDSQARPALRHEVPPPLTPCPLLDSLAAESWCADEQKWLDLGDVRLNRRAERVLESRWAQPQASFYGSFSNWAGAKGAYQLLEHPSELISLESLLASHGRATQERMAAEAVVLLPQDTTTLNYSSLKRTTGLGPLGEAHGRGLWLHSLLAFRPDGLPLGVLHARCWARTEDPGGDAADPRGRNAKSIEEKESARWVQALRVAGAAARRMPQTRLVTIADREGDIFEMYEDTHHSPANLHSLIRVQHDRNLAPQQKLWAFMTALPPGQTQLLHVPRRRGQKARWARVEVRWSEVAVQAPRVGCKKGWSSLALWAVWVHEPNPEPGVEPLDWMLLTDLPVTTAAEALEKVQWYKVRWGIEEWHRVLKSGCHAEKREFKTAGHLMRALAFDLIVAWRVLACLKLGRAMPQLPATVVYTADELEVLGAAFKKNSADGLPGPDPA